jgi:hypothetical protein
MGFNQKSSKGEIKTENFRGRIRLRRRYNGERYPLSLPYDGIKEGVVYLINPNIEERLYPTKHRAIW